MLSLQFEEYQQNYSKTEKNLNKLFWKYINGRHEVFNYQPVNTFDLEKTEHWREKSLNLRITTFLCHKRSAESSLNMHAKYFLLGII